VLVAALTVLTLLAQDFRVPVPPIEDDPKLPRVLLIGDSISIGYGLPVRKLLSGKANVHRIPLNGGTTGNGVFMMDSWLGKDKWDVIHFNFGLHDLKLLDDGLHQVPIESYRRYLRLIVARLKRTNAKLIFATTTPVPEGTETQKVSPPRRPADVTAYNAAAKEIMRAEGIPVNDLYAFAQPRLATLQLPVNVHFTNSGSEALAAQVASAITAALPKPETLPSPKLPQPIP
jgi:acyl-CoA thioesterase-1